MKITYFVHATTEDNQRNLATGQEPGELSEIGVRQAEQLGEKVDEDFEAFYCSDLRRAVKSARIAFGDEYSIIKDERLRECDYGSKTREPHDWDLKKYIEKPYPGGESYRQVEERIEDLLDFISEKHEAEKIALMAHQAPQLALEVVANGKTWEEAIEEDWRKNGEWQPGWKYEL
ncbi:MAG: histidine phosphatase family protein [Candidatus Nanohaloarchaea archaeon]